MPSITPRLDVGFKWNSISGHGSELSRSPEVLGGGSGDRLTRLARTIEAEIIPRLLLAHRALAADESFAHGTIPSAEDVLELARLVLAHEHPVGLSFVQVLRDQGVALENIYLDLLAPCARKLGQYWCDDSCDFAEVTVGAWRLQRVMHALNPEFRAESDACECGRRALLVPVPGEQHTFGGAMVAEFFRRAGWDVHDGPLTDEAALVDLVRREFFDLVGLSMAGERHAERLGTTIQALRRTSRNRKLGVMVGGRVFEERPELVTAVGADATAADAADAIKQAQRLLSLLARSE